MSILTCCFFCRCCCDSSSLQHCLLFFFLVIAESRSFTPSPKEESKKSYVRKVASAAADIATATGLGILGRTSTSQREDPNSSRISSSRKEDTEPSEEKECNFSIVFPDEQTAFKEEEEGKETKSFINDEGEESEADKEETGASPKTRTMKILTQTSARTTGRMEKSPLLDPPLLGGCCSRHLHQMKQQK